MKKYSKAKSNEQIKNEVEELSKKYKEGIEKYIINDPDNYAEVLKNYTKFHQYSITNYFLMFLQMPTVTHVAGYKTWQNNFNRQVKAKEKAIRIIAPNMSNSYSVPDGKGGYIQISWKEAKNRNDAVKDTFVRGFKVASVFDISQTEQIEGKEEIKLEQNIHDLAGEVNGYQMLLEALSKVTGIEFKYEDITDGAHGYFRALTNEIVIQNDMSQMQTLKTAIHETSHALLHSVEATKKRKDDGEEEFTQEDKETQAESIACIVMSYYGFDSKDYSFPYVQGWAGNVERVDKNMNIISKTANDIIKKMDSVIERRD